MIEKLVKNDITFHINSYISLGPILYQLIQYYFFM